MSDTPITDNRILQINTAMKRPPDAPMMLDETARQLERMCNELADRLEASTSIYERQRLAALARWQAMKEKK